MEGQLDMALNALWLLLQPSHLTMLMVGVLFGLAVGAMPGLGGVVALAVLIPFTYNLDPVSAFALLIGVAAVTTTSDLIPAILFGVPGTVGAAATVIDGHAMARNGEAGRAFGAGFTASLVGGIFGALMLALSIPILRPLMLSVGSPELLAFSIFGLSMVATLSGRAPLKGLTAAALGLMLAMIGSGTQTGQLRWTFDFLYLFDGLPLVPVTLGLFALPELAELAVKRKSISGGAGIRAFKLADQWQGVRDVYRNWWLVIRCSAFGTALGTMPGLGSAVIDWIVYGYAVRNEPNPEKFGKGDVRGVIAPESANNAKEGGHLVPTIAFGVPAGASMTLLLGAFLIHGLSPGPEMLTTNLDITYSIIWSLTLAHVIGSAICIFSTRWLARIAEIRHQILLPLIAPIVFIAAFEATRSWGDLYTLLGFGILGWVMKSLGWPRPPMVLGFVLGDIFERYLFLSNAMYPNMGWLFLNPDTGSWIPRPVIAVVGILIVWALYRPLRETVVTLFRQFRHLDRAQLRLGVGPIFTLGVIAVVTAALVTSSSWPVNEQIVPRTACWAALIAGCLNLVAEVFGTDKKGDGLGAPMDTALEASAELPALLMQKRAAVFFSWLAGLIVLVSLVGFLPAIGVFVFAYMRFGFGLGSLKSAIYSAIALLFCWAVFDQALLVPWPAALLGDIFPALRDATRLL